MTNSYKELLMQREALEQAIAAARAHELSEAITKARELVAEFGLTVQDVFPSGRAASACTTTSRHSDSNTTTPNLPKLNIRHMPIEKLCTERRSSSYWTLTTAHHSTKME